MKSREAVLIYGCRPMGSQAEGRKFKHELALLTVYESILLSRWDVHSWSKAEPFILKRLIIKKNSRSLDTKILWSSCSSEIVLHKSR